LGRVDGAGEEQKRQIARGEYKSYARGERGTERTEALVAWLKGYEKWGPKDELIIRKIEGNCRGEKKRVIPLPGVTGFQEGQE